MAEVGHAMRAPRSAHFCRRHGAEQDSPALRVSDRFGELSVFSQAVDIHQGLLAVSVSHRPHSPAEQP
jgi:hypothetical protein